jgi:transglutaminase-like putative cysteine protease
MNNPRLVLIGTFLMTTMTIQSAPAQQTTPQETGASLAWTSDDPVIKQVIALLHNGKFSEAQSLLASDDGHGNPDVAAVRAEMQELIDRLRQEYSLDESGLLAKLKKSIPDVTPADLTKWRETGELQYRMVDGQVMYFRREPSNLFRFCAEAKQRAHKDIAAADREPDKGEAWHLVDHLAEVVRQGEASETPLVNPVRHRIQYTLTIPANTSGIKSGSLVRVWLPFPQEYRQQQDVKLITTLPTDAKVAPNGTPQRTVYFEQRVADPSHPLTFSETLEFTSYAYYPKLDYARVQPLPPDWNGAELSERPPHIGFTPEIRRQVAQIVGDETNPLAKVRKIYHWIDANIRYHAEEEYCVIPSFATACLSRRKGDCGIQSTLFITMCRVAGIPARWQSGWETKPAGWNMHDWTEVYIAPWGWLPCDPSYGVQKSDDPKVADFYIGHQDSYRMIVNLDYGRQLCPPKPSLRSEPADFQRGEVEVDGRNLYFDGWDYEMKITVDGKELK